MESIPIQWIWAALVIIFGLIEVFTLGLTTIWFAISALILVILSFFDIPNPVQIVIFFAISAILLFFTRPLIIKKIKTGKAKTNVESLQGKHVLISKKISEFETGETKINGIVWRARAEGNEQIDKGTKCEIIKVEGVQLIVRPLEEQI